MTTLFKMPRKVYVAAISFPDGEVEFGMAHDSMSDAVSSVVDHDDHDWRIYSLEHDPDTNMPEQFRDVTEDAINDYHTDVYATRDERQLAAEADEREQRDWIEEARGILRVV